MAPLTKSGTTLPYSISLPACSSSQLVSCTYVRTPHGTKGCSRKALGKKGRITLWTTVAIHPCHIHRHSPAGRGRRKFWNRHVALPHRFDSSATDADSHQQTFHSFMQLLAQKTLIYQSMKQTIDITHWNRREHFEFFSRFDDPFFRNHHTRKLY